MTNPTHTAIQQTIDENDIVLFMKGTADFPMCGFSNAVVSILEDCGVTFTDINVMASDDLRQGIKDFSNWPTIPQIYVKGEFIGGCDIVQDMHQAGELQTLLKDKGLVQAA